MTESERCKQLVAAIEARSNDPHPSSVHNATTRHDVLFVLAELQSMATRYDAFMTRVCTLQACVDGSYRAIKNAVELLGPEYCDDGKPLESLRRALDEMETAKD